jgi:diketogulonate reductase-like aldo/keto reductase
MMVERVLNERTYAIVDGIIAVAKELDTSPSRVALAWVVSRPGVASTIIGARTLEQLEQNLGGLDVKLSAAHLAKLDELSRPSLGFPMAFLANAYSFMHGGISVNGVAAPQSPFGGSATSKRW